MITWDEVVEAWENTPKEELENPTHEGKYANTCIDWVRLKLEVVDGKIKRASKAGQGCILSQGIAQCLVEAIIGMTVEEARDFDLVPDFKISTNRTKCSAISFLALEKALR